MTTNQKKPEAPVQNLSAPASSSGELSADLARKRAAAIAQRLSAFKRMSGLPTHQPTPEGHATREGSSATGDSPNPDASAQIATAQIATAQISTAGDSPAPAGEPRPRPAELGHAANARRGERHPFLQAYAIGQEARRRQDGEPAADKTDQAHPFARYAPDEPPPERSRAEAPSRLDAGAVRRQALYGSDFSALMRATDSARTEAAWADAALAEAARAEAARLEAERAAAAQTEAARLEAERAEAAWEEAARAEAVEAARAEAARAARVEAARVEAARAEAVRAEAERAEATRIEAERVEAGRVEAERAKAARAEAERAEAERVELARAEAERAEAERAEAARAEAERLAAARAEAERLDAERAEAARLEAERQEDLQLDEVVDETPLDDARDEPRFNESRLAQIRIDAAQVDDLRRDEPWLDEAAARAADADNPRAKEPEIDESWLDESRDEPAQWAPIAAAARAPARRWPRRVAGLAGFVAIVAAALGATFLWQLRDSGPGSQPPILAASQRAADKLAQMLAHDPQPQAPSEPTLATSEAAPAPDVTEPPEPAPELASISEPPSAEVLSDETPAPPIVARAPSANHPPATRPGSSRPVTTLTQLPDSEAIGTAPIVPPSMPEASGQAMAPQPFSPAAKPKPIVAATLKPNAAQAAVAPTTAAVDPAALSEPVAQPVAKPLSKPAKPAAKPTKQTKASKPVPAPIKEVLNLLAPFMNGSKPQPTQLGNRK